MIGRNGEFSVEKDFKVETSAGPVFLAEGDHQQHLHDVPWGYWLQQATAVGMSGVGRIARGRGG